MTTKETNTIQQVKINIPGGVITTGDFIPLTASLQEVGIKQLHIGMRQELLFNADEQQIEQLQYSLTNDDWLLEVNQDHYPNIVSSYVADELFNRQDWVRESVYKDILDGFNYKPRLKINISDAQQSFVPYFSGHLNFISSAISQHWYLCIRFPKSQLRYTWSSLFYTGDIPELCQVIEHIFHTEQQQFPIDNAQEFGQLLEQTVSAKHLFATQEYEQSFKPPTFLLPYYEGFNSYQNKYWLGIYRRNKAYSLAFLQDIGKTCLSTGITQIHCSPWRSLIIKQIDPNQRSTWHTIMDKHHISLRHASSELNWQIDESRKALEIKQSLSHYFNEEDVRTYKLCFGVKTTAQSGVWGSILIRLTEQKNEPETARYAISYTADFNPHTSQEIYFRQDITADELGPALVQLCHLYYRQQILDQQHNLLKTVKPQLPNETEQITRYQCPDCLSIYDPQYGDGITAPGTSFENLPENYNCTTCGTMKINFLPVTKPISPLS